MEKVTSGRGLKVMREQAMWLSRGRVVQGGGRVRAKVLGYACVFKGQPGPGGCSSVGHRDLGKRCLSDMGGGGWKQF